MSDVPSKSKRIVDRSPAYPSIDLKTAVDLSKKLFDQFSDYDFTREVASEKLGLARNANTFRKIAALVQYGLLKREGNTYKITSLAKGIVLSTNDDEKTKLLVTAVHKPKIYATLITENSGKGLPSSLDNRLRQLEYSKDAAKGLAIIFKHSLEYSGLLKNGIVANSVEELDRDTAGNITGDEPKQGLETEIPSGKPIQDVRPLAPQANVNSGEHIPYPLDCGIIVMFPYSMIKKVMSGAFLTKMNELEELGKGEVDGSSANNASDASVESD